jgi:DNA-binding NarL/FixJ family response regulator
MATHHTTREELLKEVESLRSRLADQESTTLGRMSQIEHALRERIKELGCMYTISRLREQHFHSPDKFLQGVVDCLPGSWQYPEHACARIVYGDRTFRTEPFREGSWRMAATVSGDGKPTGMVEVFYPEAPPHCGETPFLNEEYALINAVAERISSVMMHIQSQEDLGEAHKALQREHQSLQEMNIALRAVLSRLEEEKQEIRASILANIQKILMPIVFELELEVTGRQRSYVTLLRQNLQEIASPFLSHISRNHMELSPVEIAISTMIRNGLATKEIAQLRCISSATVRRHRENIRKKLGLRNRRANLVTYLQSCGGDEPAAGGNRTTKSSGSSTAKSAV